MERYGRLIELVHKHKPMTIVEVGTFDGTRALQMVEAALQHNPYVHYTGYDLFNTTDIDTHRREFNVADGTNELIKKPLTMHDIAAKFDQSPLDFTYQLVMGDTRSTLRVHTDDFAFIDGGHSVETIRLDYEKLRRCSVVVFDDYYKTTLIPNSSAQTRSSTRFRGPLSTSSTIGCNTAAESVLPRSLTEAIAYLSGIPA